MQKKMLPLGIEDFGKMMQEDFYYIDKTGLIIDLLRNQAEVTLFTRPRRFGKSLNMDMLKSFFSVHSDKTLFSGLKITEEKEQNRCAMACQGCGAVFHFHIKRQW